MMVTITLMLAVLASLQTSLRLMIAWNTAQSTEDKREKRKDTGIIIS
jgi:hypothetical protein